MTDMPEMRKQQLVEKYPEVLEDIQKADNYEELKSGIQAYFKAVENGPTDVPPAFGVVVPRVLTITTILEELEKQWSDPNQPIEINYDEIKDESIRKAIQEKFAEAMAAKKAIIDFEKSGVTFRTHIESFQNKAAIDLFEKNYFFVKRIKPRVKHQVNEIFSTEKSFHNALSSLIDYSKGYLAISQQPIDDAKKMEAKKEMIKEWFFTKAEAKDLKITDSEVKAFDAFLKIAKEIIMVQERMLHLEEIILFKGHVQADKVQEFTTQLASLIEELGKKCLEVAAIYPELERSMIKNARIDYTEVVLIDKSDNFPDSIEAGKLYLKTDGEYRTEKTEKERLKTNVEIKKNLFDKENSPLSDIEQQTLKTALEKPELNLKAPGKLIKRLALKYTVYKSDTKQSFAFSGIFIQPIQRPPRYVLFGRELLKDFQASEEASLVKTLLTKADAAGFKMNEAKRVYEQEEAFNQIFAKKGVFTAVLGDKSLESAVTALKEAIDNGSLEKINSTLLSKTKNELLKQPEFLTVTLGAHDPKLTPVQAAKQLSDYIDFGFVIKFQTEAIRESWSKKIANVPVTISGPLEPQDALKRAIKNGLFLKNNGFKVNVSKSFFIACETYQKGRLMDDPTTASFVTAMKKNIIMDDATPAKMAEAKRAAEAEKTLVPPLPAATPEEQQAPAPATPKMQGDILEQIREAEGSPERAKQLALPQKESINKLKEEIVLGKLRDRAPENLAETIGKLLSEYPEGLTVTLGAPDVNMTGKRAAQQLSDYISCGFKIKFKSPEVIAGWKEKINDKSTISSIEVRDLPGLSNSNSLLLMKREANQVNLLFKDGFKIFPVSDAFYVKLNRNAHADPAISTLIKQGVFVKPPENSNENPLPPKPIRKTPEKAVEAEEANRAALQSEGVSVPAPPMGQQSAGAQLQEAVSALPVKEQASQLEVGEIDEAEIAAMLRSRQEQSKSPFDNVIKEQQEAVEKLETELKKLDASEEGRIKMPNDSTSKESQLIKRESSELRKEIVIQKKRLEQLQNAKASSAKDFPLKTKSGQVPADSRQLHSKQEKFAVDGIPEKAKSQPAHKQQQKQTVAQKRKLPTWKEGIEGEPVVSPVAVTPPLFQSLPISPSAASTSTAEPKQAPPISRSASSEASLVQPSSESAAVVVPDSQTKAPLEPPKKEKRVLAKRESAPLLLSKLPQASIRPNTRNPQPKINIFDENQIKAFIKDLQAYRDSVNNKKQDSFLHKLGMGKLEARSLQAGGLITALENSLESKDLLEVKDSLLEVKRQIKNWRLPEKIYGKSELQEKVDVIIHQLGLQEPDKSKKNTPNGSGA